MTKRKKKLLFIQIIIFTLATLLIFFTYYKKDLNNENNAYNPLKEEKYIPGTSIPIIMKSKMPIYKDQLIICFAWNFFDDIYSKLKLENINGTLLNIQNGKKKEL